MWSQLLPRLHPELHLPLPQLHTHGLAVAQDVAAPGGEVDKPAIILQHWKYLFVLKILLRPVAAGTHDLHPAEHDLVRPVPDQRGGGPAVGHVVLQVGAVSPGYVICCII